MSCVGKSICKCAVNKRKSQQRVVLLFSKLGKFLTDNTEKAKMFNYFLHLPSVKTPPLLAAAQQTLVTRKRDRSSPSGNEEKCLHIGWA